MSGQNDLISFVASMGGETSLRVEENYGSGFVRLRTSEAERRQAKHDIQHVEDIVVEMLRNARDAGAQRIYLATHKEEGIRTLLFIDDGRGVPEDMQKRIFEARVTSKLESMKMDKWGVHGRGMALFSISQNTQSAQVITSSPDLGSSFEVIVDTNTLTERSDQSTWPQCTKDEDGNLYCARGPHNILRVASEFACEELHGCDVYLGTPTEIAATMYAHAQKKLDASQLVFLDSEKTLPLVTRLGYASDASELIDIATSLGISVSERTAHRIIAGSITPLKSVASRLLREKQSGGHKTGPIDLQADRRGLKIAQEDLHVFSRSIEKAFNELASSYFISLASDPKIRVTKDKISISLEIAKEDT